MELQVSLDNIFNCIKLVRTFEGFLDKGELGLFFFFFNHHLLFNSLYMM